MKKQRIMSLLLAFAMVFSLLPASAMAVKVETFEDISKDDWYYKYVDFVTDKEYFVGTSKTTFSPEMSMTRAMFVVVLAALEGVKVDNNVSPFADVPANTWYSGAVKWAADKGVVAGIGDNKFAPDTAISREQMAVMMKAYVKWHEDKTGETHKMKSKVKSFNDPEKVSSWAVESVEACRKWGLIAGAPDGNFYPQNTATRAEVATVIYNLAWLITGGGGGGGGSVTPPGHTCVDADKDHKCDICGGAMGGACADANNDHKCDYCGAKISDCADNNNDHNCDVCGDKISDCADADKDHYCDVCGSELTQCTDDNDDHKCDICEAAMCPGEDLIFNAMVNAAKDVKAGLDAQGKLVTDASKLDEAVAYVLEKSGALNLINYGLDNGNGYVRVGGNDTFASVTAVTLTQNKCLICGAGEDPHPSKVDTVLSLNTSSAKEIVDMYGLSYEMAVNAAKTMVAGIGYTAAMMTKDEAIAIANAVADKFEEVTGIPVAKATIEKAVEILKAAPADGMAFASDVWNNNFKNDNGYVTGDVSFTVNDTTVTVKVSDADGVSMDGSKTEAVTDLAVAIAKDLYGDLKANASDWSTLPEITADEAFGFTATVAFSQPDNADNAEKTDCFTYTYPVEFTFTAAGDAFNYVEYKYDGIHNVKIIVPEKVQELYTAAANKVVKTVLVPYLSNKMQGILSGLNFGVSTLAVAAEVPAIDMDALMQQAIDAWLSQNLTTGDISSSTLLGVVNGTVSADELNNEAIHELIDTTLENNLESMLGGVLDPGDADSVSLAGDPEALNDLLKEAVGEENYTKLEDMGLVDYTVAKTQDYLDPEAINNNGVKYTEETTNAAGEVIKPTEQMKESVSNVVADTIDKTFNPSTEDEGGVAVDPALIAKAQMYKKALNAVSALSSVEAMTNVELSTLASILTNDTFQGYLEGRGDAIVNRVCDLVAYIPESASVTVGDMAIEAADLAALAAAETSVDACNAVAGILNVMGDLSLASFAGEGLDISVAVGGKSVTFGLAIEF